MKQSHVRTIGTALTILGVVATGVLAYRGGLNAQRIIDEKGNKRVDDESDGSGRIERTRRQFKRIVSKARPTVKCWAPAAITGAATIFVAGYTHHANVTTIATLSGLAASSRELYNRAHKELKKNKDLFRDYMYDLETTRKLPDDILRGNEPEELFYDSFLDEFFYSSQVAVSTMINEINVFYHENDYASLYEMYKMIGLPFIVGDADAIGWSITDKNAGLRDIWIDTYNMELDGQPFTVIDYDYLPDYLG